MRRALILGLLGLVLCVRPAPAAAEDTPDGYAETEHRLKTAGIDEAMRLEIHEAIRKGVAVLRKLQDRRGAILGQGGQTVLGGLALAHAGIPEGEAGGKAAQAWVLKYGRKAVASRTYEAGLGAMMFDSLPPGKRETAYLMHLHDRLRRGPKSDLGYWGYRSAGGDPTPNLSTAQFACLGMWAAERRGAKPATKAWKLHLDTLLKGHLEGGSWGYYSPHHPQFAGRNPQGYATGTFMGIANVALAREALKEEIASEPEYDAKVRIAVAKGKAALRRHTQWILTVPEMHGALGHFGYYRLYALEKACVFLDLEDVGGVRWYRQGARYLLDNQLPGTGGWDAMLSPERRRLLLRSGAKAQPQAQYTAFALLFLLRASAAYHPVTPRPVGRPKVVTPSGEPAPEEGDAPAKKSAPPLVLAKGALERLEKALEGKRLWKLRPVVDSMRLVSRLYRSSRTKEGFASPGHEAWARRVDDTILRLAVRFRRAKANDRLLWQAVALAAMEAMPDLHPRIGPRLMDAVLAMERDKAFPPPYRYVWYATAMETLRRINPPGLATWLSTRAISLDSLLWWRTSAALTALGGLAPQLSGRQRHGVARSIWRHLAGLRRRSRGNLPALGLVRDILVTMHRLAGAAGRPGDMPPIGALGPGETFDHLEGWWKQHDQTDDPLWR